MHACDTFSQPSGIRQCSSGSCSKHTAQACSDCCSLSLTARYKCLTYCAQVVKGSWAASISILTMMRTVQYMANSRSTALAASKRVTSAHTHVCPAAAMRLQACLCCSQGRGADGVDAMA
jgi:hypothetical protein